jgi:hypothetical protein
VLYFCGNAFAISKQRQNAGVQHFIFSGVAGHYSRGANMETKRLLFWMADKVFALHSLLSLIICIRLFLANMPAAAGGVIAL